MKYADNIYAALGLPPRLCRIDGGETVVSSQRCDLRAMDVHEAIRHRDQATVPDQIVTPKRPDRLHGGGHRVEAFAAQAERPPVRHKTK